MSAWHCPRLVRSSSKPSVRKSSAELSGIILRVSSASTFATTRLVSKAISSAEKTLSRHSVCSQSIPGDDQTASGMRTVLGSFEASMSTGIRTAPYVLMFSSSLSVITCTASDRMPSRSSSSLSTSSIVETLIATRVNGTQNETKRRVDFATTTRSCMPVSLSWTRMLLKSPSMSPKRGTGVGSKKLGCGHGTRRALMAIRAMALMFLGPAPERRVSICACMSALSFLSSIGPKRPSCCVVARGQSVCCSETAWVHCAMLRMTAVTSSKIDACVTSPGLYVSCTALRTWAKWLAYMHVSGQSPLACIRSAATCDMEGDIATRASLTNSAPSASSKTGHSSSKGHHGIQARHDLSSSNSS